MTTEHGLKKPLTVDVDKTGRVTISSVAPDADQRKIMLAIMESATSSNDHNKVRVTVSSFPGREMAQKTELIKELKEAGYNLKPPEQGKGRSFSM